MVSTGSYARQNGLFASQSDSYRVRAISRRERLDIAARARRLLALANMLVASPNDRFQGSRHPDCIARCRLMTQSGHWHHFQYVSFSRYSGRVWGLKTCLMQIG